MIKVAFIGAGYMTTEHLKAFADIEQVEVVGIHSRTKTKAVTLSATYPGLVYFDSVAKMYEACKPDIVVISVPELSVRTVCEEAFRFSWMCLVEKPAGFDYDDAESIYRSAIEHQARVFVGLNRRHYSSTLNVMQDMSAVEEKRLIHVYDQENPKAALAVGQPQKVTENWMYANAIHLVDYFSFLGRGEITGINNLIRFDPESPLFVLSKIEYSSGDIGIYECVWNAPGPWSIVINTASKRWEMRPVEQATVQVYNSRKQEPFQVHEWDTKFKPGLRRQAQETINALMGLPHTLPALADALRSMQIIKSIYFENE